MEQTKQIDAFDIFDEPQVKQEFETAFSKLSEIEEVQLLSDLDYLPEEAFDDHIIDNNELSKAIAVFRADYKAALSKTELSNLKTIHNDSLLLESDAGQANQLSQRELYVLKEITGLDEELTINNIELNVSSLLSRVMLYRYRVYDRNAGIKPSQPFTPQVRDALDIASRQIGFQDGWLAFGNVLADQSKLTSFYMTAPTFTKSIFGTCMFIMPNTEAGKQVIEELGGSIERKIRFRTYVTSEYAKSKVVDLTRSNNPQQVQEYINSISNEFITRILQVKLWMTGLYRGKLDSDFGPLSITALSDFLTMLAENDKIERRHRGRILYNLGDDQCIINLHYLLTNYLIPMETTQVSEEQQSVSQVVGFVMEDKSTIGQFNTSQQEDLTQGSQELTTSLGTELQSESKAIINDTQRRRQYKAKRGLAKFFSKVIQWVKNAFTKLMKLLKKLLGVIKKIAKFIYGEIKEAFMNFKTGMKFLFGKRIISTGSTITTDYDFDFDGITKIHGKPTKEQLESHIKEIKESTAHIYSSLSFVKTVIQWGINLVTGPLGWIKILVGIAKLFKEWLKKQKAEKLIQMALVPQ